LRDEGGKRRLRVYLDVGSTMSETEKKGSTWPWIAVPVAAVTVFFVLRECQDRLPPAERASSPAVTVPATPESPQPADPAADPAHPAATPAVEPTPQ
jgi:hypothetical protein